MIGFVVCAVLATSLPAARWDDSSPPPEPASHERLASILQGPEFSEARDRPSTLLQRALVLLQEMLLELFQSRSTQRFAESTRTIVLLLFAVLAGMGLLRLIRHRNLRRRATEGAPRGVERLPLESPQSHLQRARAATHPREGLRQALLALLSSLEKHQFARPDRVKTNREIAGELSARGAPEPLASAARGLLGIYDRAYYSLEPITAERAGDFIHQVAHFESSLESVR
jgi:hypothetical protein